MSQHDFNIANQGFPATRADINNAFQAIASNSSGATAPATTYANMWWYDTANNKMYLRNEADSAWIEVATIDQTNNEWQITTGTVQAADGDGLVLKTDEGTARITIADSGNVTIANDLTVNGNLDVSSGTIKLDGNYPTGTSNVALGDAALDDGSLSGNNNVAIGSSALTANTTGTSNSGLGKSSLGANVTGNSLTAIGSNALLSNTTSGNTAVGSNAAYSNTSGRVDAFGLNAAYNNTTGNYNSAFGQQNGFLAALQSNTTGSSNAAFATGALGNTTTGSSNTGIGVAALYSNNTASNNTAVGYQAGYSTNNSAATFNTMLGYQAGYSNTSGSTNTFIGPYSGYSMTTGSNNTILGRYNGNQGGLDIRTSSNNIVLSDGDGNPRLRIDSVGNTYINTQNDMGGILNVSRPDGIAIGNANDQTYYRRLYGAGTGANMELRFWNGSNEGVLNSSGSWVNASDISLKENIVDTSYGLSTVLNLQPRNYTMIEGGNAEVGFIAQEMELVIPEVVNTSQNPNGEEIKGISYGQLTAVLTKAIQEQQATITELEARITALENA